jgi:hypothetical protein
MDPQETGWEGVDWVHVAQDRDRCRDLVNNVMNLHLQQRARNFFTTPATTSFTRTQPHRISSVFCTNFSVTFMLE